MDNRPIQKIRRDNLTRMIEQVGGNRALAELLDVDPSYISNLKTGKKKIGDDTAERIEETLNMHEGDLDIDRRPDDSATSEVRDEAPSEYSDFIRIPGYRAQAEAGGGILNWHDEVVEGGFVFKRSSLGKAGLLGKRLSCIFSKGDSMEPTLSDGDMILISQDEPDFRDGRLYVVQWGDEVRVKRLFRRPDGMISVRSDNPDKQRFPDESTSPDADGFRLIGRVVWRGGWT